MLNETVSTQDERLNAALAHASVLLGLLSRGVLGIVLAFLVWVTQRTKSPFAARHAAQAVVYQLIGGIMIIIAFVGWGVLFAGSILVPLIIDSENPEPMMPYAMIPALALLFAPFALMFAWVAYGLYAAWKVWRGENFAYPIIGQWVK